MRLRIKSTRLTMKIIGWFQIIGGILGLGAVAYLMLHTGQVNGAILLIFFIGISLFIFSLYAGGQLLITDNPTSGLVMSIINHGLQLFQWKFLGYGMLYASGTQFSIGLEQTIEENIRTSKFGLNFQSLYSEFNFSIMSGEELMLRINLVALLILIVLIDIIRERKRGQIAVDTLTTDKQNTREE